jgi:DNA-binding CsgD family transcriptional regulator
MKSLPRLTDKEREALRLLAAGHTAKTIAQSVGLPVNTINERLRSARRKTGLTSSRELARLLVSQEAGGLPEKLGNKEIGLERTHRRHHPRAQGFAAVARSGAAWRGATVIGVILGAALLAAQTSVPAAPSNAPTWAVVFINLREDRFVAIDARSVERQAGTVTYTVGKTIPSEDEELDYSVTRAQTTCDGRTYPADEYPKTEEEGIFRVVCQRDRSFTVGPLVPEITLEFLGATILGRPVE